MNKLCIHCVYSFAYSHISLESDFNKLMNAYFKMASRSCKFLTISSWNINGLEFKAHGVKSNKLHDPEVMNILKKSDFIGLMEKYAEAATDTSLNGYYVFCQDRPKHQKAWKSSGGIAVLVNERLRNYCKVDPLSDSDVIWVRVQKQVTKVNCDLFLGFVYCQSIQPIVKHMETIFCKKLRNI